VNESDNNNAIDKGNQVQQLKQQVGETKDKEARPSAGHLKLTVATTTREKGKLNRRIAP